MTDITAAADLLPRSNIHSYSLGEELILFDELSKKLFRNNSTAALIWQGCSSGFSREEIIAALSQETNATAEQITNDVNGLISQWCAGGLLQTNSQSSLPGQPIDAAEHPVNIMGYNGPLTRLPSGSPEYRFRILDTYFRLKVPTKKELQLVTPILSHLAVPHENKGEVHLSIVYADGGYLLLHNERLVDWCAHIDGIGPMLHGNALVIAYEMTDCLMGLHAAAVYCNGKCILMPAPSGSGKSTLTAALVGSGFSHCADDLVLLTPAPVYMRPVPVAVGLKTGSWNLLASYHPDLALLPTHLRSDGKQVRYLVPSVNTIMPMESQPVPVDYILFSQFADNGNKAILTEISAAEGLCRLAAAGYEMHGEMAAGNIQQLVDWITDVPCYQMHFNQLDDAVSVIQKLIS